MLHWHRKYARNRTTMTAYSDTGHTLTIISTGITNPVNVYESAPGAKNKSRFATVPSIENAILCAEERNLINLRHTAYAPEDSPGVDSSRRARARRALNELDSGAKDYFILEVPRMQTLTAQRLLELASLRLRLAPHQPKPGYDMPSLVPQTRIYEAAKRVNEDLDKDGLQPRLELPPILGDPDNPRRWLEFFHHEYRWDQNQQITARLWQDRGGAWDETAACYCQLMARPKA